MDNQNDDYIANTIIQSELLLVKYEDTINKLTKNKFIIAPPTSDLDPYYIISSEDNKIKLSASYIAKTLPIKKGEKMKNLN